MLEKITAFLLGLLLVQLALYGHTALDVEADQYPENVAEYFAPKNQDVTPLLEKLGIRTEVDEQLLEKKYPSTRIFTNSENGNATLSFHNPNKHNYRLDIYDLDKGLVASYVNVNSEQIEIEREMFMDGAYIYKLEGNSNTYCGTFMLQ